MRKPTDTTLRYLALLQLIPAYPKMMSVAELQKALRDKNDEYEIGARSLQRDLNKLSGVFPLSSEFKGRTQYWFWPDKNDLLQIPAMNSNTALAFKLASEQLRSLLPPSVLRLLAPYFNHARGVLEKTKLGKWSAKTRIISRGPKLIAPVVKGAVQEVVYQALLEGKQFEANYKSKGQTTAKRRVLNPLGLVVRDGIIYLIATAQGYTDPRHYALHRMSRASLSDRRANAISGFDLAHYIEEEKGFSYPVSGKKIKLRALFARDAAVHLSESMLSNDQTITDKKDGWVLVEATVADTAELRWWLLGFGSYVEVVGPRGLREEFVGVVEGMGSIYTR